MVPVSSVYQLLSRLHGSDSPALFSKKEGVYTSISYVELFLLVSRFASGLSSLGVQPGDRIGILSSNRMEWVVADMAILALGAVVVPLYPTLGPEEMAHILKDAGVSILILESETHLSSCFQLPSLPVLRVLVCISAVPISHHLFQVLSFESLYLDVPVSLPSVNLEDLASIVYTSGTTGLSKGVMLSHGNILSNVFAILEIVPISSSDVLLSFLPLSHVFERVVGYYVPIASGAQIYYATSISTVAEDLLLSKPTVVISVPRLYEKIHSKVMGSLSGFKKRLFLWALDLGQRRGPLFFKTPSLFDKLQLWLANLFVYRAFRKKTGGRLRFFVSGGAPLSLEISRFFAGLGILIVEGYGQTESSPVITCNSPDVYRFGTVGKPLPGVSCHLSSDGELLAKGPNIMKGYWNLPEKTLETIDTDGYLHTGDVAVFDSDGFVTIVDRIKELIVLSNGKKVSPIRVELALQHSPYILQSLVLGDSRNYISALIVPDFEALSSKFPHFSFQELKVSLDVYEFMADQISQQLKDFSGFEKVKRFSFIDTPFSQEDGTLTPTLKPKRKVLSEKYHAVIEKMYKGDTE